ncbi:MAG: hypothetical protein ACI4VK_04185 [Candidatus Coproplasma sp.]
MSNNEKNNSTKALSPYILIQPYQNGLTISKDVVKCLGFPTHICLRINETTNSFAIIPCEPDDVMSFKVPEKLLTDHHCVFRIHSKQFMFNLVLKYDLDIKNVYNCKGIYSPKMNAVIFSLEQDNLQVGNSIMAGKIN